MKFNVQIAFSIVLISELFFYAETKSKLRLKLENQKYSNYKDVILLHYGVAEMNHKIYDRFIQIAKHFDFNPKVNYFRLIINTGKSLSEALLFAEHGENMLCTKIVLNVGNNFCTQHVLPRFELGIFMYWTCNSMNNLSSYCGLFDAKIRASDKDLLVLYKPKFYSRHLFNYFSPNFRTWMTV